MLFNVCAVVVASGAATLKPTVEMLPSNEHFVALPMVTIDPPEAGGRLNVFMAKRVELGLLINNDPLARVV